MGQDILYIDGKPVVGDVIASQVVNDGPNIGDDVAAALTNLDDRVTPNTAQLGATMTNTSGGNLPLGALVILDTGASSFTTTTTASDPLARYVLLEAIVDTATGRVASSGYATVLTTGVVAVGDTLGASGTNAGYAEAGETGLGVALTASGGGFGSVLAAISGGASGTSEYAIIVDQKTAGVNGGSAGAATYQTRDLTTVRKAQSWLALSTPLANQFTLQAGTYLIAANAPASSVNRHVIKLQNITTAALAILGSGATAGSVDTGTETTAFLRDEITIASANVFEIQHWTQSARANTGLGFETQDGNPGIFTEVIIYKTG